jgi:hypothetical protein
MTICALSVVSPSKVSVIVALSPSASAPEDGETVSAVLPVTVSE